MSLRLNRLHRIVRVIAVAFFAAQAWAGSPVPDFCFLHTSDNHLTPQPVGSPPPQAGDRAVDGLTWLRDEAGKPQLVAPLNLTTPPPAFVIDTGDVTEYGVINTTWQSFEEIMKPLPVPLFITPGNHDNTWTTITSVMRARYGSDHYSFERFGCHFACIDTATPQEPLPSLEKRTLDWLTGDLKRVDRETPVFLFCHHPLTSSAEYASVFEPLRLLEVIERHNVVLLMMGHGHGHRHEKWNTVDSVMGGTSSHPEPSIGYNIVFVKDGILRVAFRYRDPAKPMELTLEKPIAPQHGPELTFLSPKPSTLNSNPSPLTANELPIRVQIRDAEPTAVTAALNGNEKEIVPLSRARSDIYEGKLAASDLLPGQHFVKVTAAFGKQKFDWAEQLLFAPSGSPAAARIVLDAGTKAQPVLTPDGLIVATTGGEIVRIEFPNSRRPVAKRLFDTGVQLLHAPAVVDGCLYVSAAEKGVHCLSLEGRLLWKCDVGAAVYGTPAVAPDSVYVADMEGAVHAIDRKTGKLAWSKRHASFSVEMPVLLRDGVVFFGAWDGQVYAVNVKDGSLKWAKPGPAGYDKGGKLKSRYYAPADCPPLAIGDRLFVTDRAYHLGSYNLQTGEYLGDIATEVAAIGLTADAKGFYARGLYKGLTRYDGQGKPVWSQPDLRQGRFPVAPSESAGKVFVCSNGGTLSVHDAASGNVLLKYQATPQLHVMAAVAADAEGAAYIAGMDGSVTKVGSPRRD